MMMRRICLVAVLAGLLAVVAGCRASAPTYHINQETDFSFIRKVAVAPFNNLTNERAADEVVRQAVINELLVTGLVDVAVPGDAVAALDKMGIRSPSSLNAEQIKSLGKTLNVQAIILGSVDRFGEARSGNVSAPEVAITLMMAETGTGSVIWSVSQSQGGASFMSRHFGARSDTMSETVQKVVKEAVQTLAKYGR